MALQRLKEAAERAKKDLSQQTQTDINLPFITADASGAKHIQMTLTRAKFEQMVEPLIDRCRKPVMQALKDAKLSPKEINEVVLVGGMTRMPRVQQLVKEIFGKEGHKGVNPDEVVAVGAAIQGAQLLLGSKSEVLLVDVTPLTLGIETEGGILTTMIPRNTSIPKAEKQVFSTAADNQTSATIRVFQGEAQVADSPGNRLLAQFNLDGIPPAPRGVPQIEVTYDIDHNGILHVSARDVGSGKEAKVEIKGSSGLDPAEVERMRKEAEAHAGEAKKRVEVINARNEAEHTVYQIEKLLKENEGKIPDRDKAPLTAAIERVKEVSKGEDANAIKQAVSDLHQASNALAQHLHSQAPSGDGGSGGATPGGKEDVQDAEFEVKK